MTLVSVVVYEWHHPRVAGIAVAHWLCRTVLPNPVPSQKMSEGLLPWALLSTTELRVGFAPPANTVERMTMPPWAIDGLVDALPLTLLCSTKVS